MDKTSTAPNIPMGGVGMIGPGSIPTVINTIQDAPTVFVEGINGVSLTGHITKIHFTEHLAKEGELQARHILNLVVPNDQFLQIANLLKAIADQNLQTEVSKE